MSSHPPVVPTEVDSQQRTLEQRRAASAWANVEDVHTHGTSYKKEYGQLARSAPADIQTNGLGQTLAFWRAKANREPHHRALFEHVSSWTKQRIGYDGGLNLLEWVVTEASTNDYRRATAEALAFLIWIKRFAEAELAELGGD